MLYTEELEPIPAGHGYSTTNYIDRLTSETDIILIVEPAFTTRFIGKEKRPPSNWRVIDLQLEKQYLSLYEEKFVILPPYLAKALRKGAFVAKRFGESVISMHISFMRRLALGTQVPDVQIGGIERILDLLTGGEGFPHDERLAEIAKEFRLVTRVYPADRIIRVVRDYMLGALGYMRGNETFVRGPRRRQYARLMAISPAALAIGILWMDETKFPELPRLLMVVDHLISHITRSSP